MYDSKKHWEAVYSTNKEESLSWFEMHDETSLEWLSQFGKGPSSSVVDVGGGHSRWVDDLLSLGYQDITVLDLSAHALSIAKDRLQERAQQVQWLEADITKVTLPTSR